MLQIEIVLLLESYYWRFSVFVFHLGSTTFYCPSPCLIFRFKKMTTYQLNTYYVQLDLHLILLWKLQIAFLTNFVARQSTFQCNTTQQGEETCEGRETWKLSLTKMQFPLFCCYLPAYSSTWCACNNIEDRKAAFLQMNLILINVHWQTVISRLSELLVGQIL